MLMFCAVICANCVCLSLNIPDLETWSHLGLMLTSPIVSMLRFMFSFVVRSGEPHKFNASFRGPVHKRRCTDVFCCLLFILVLIAYAGLGLVAWLHGDVRKLLRPANSFGEFCGQKGTSNAKKPNVFYFNIFECAGPALLINLHCPTTQICVSECPDRLATYSEMHLQHQLGNSSWDYYKDFCKPGFDHPEKAVTQVLRDEDCPAMIVPSRPYLHRCLPDVLSLNKTKSKDLLGTTQSVTDLQNLAKQLRGLVDTQQLGQEIVEDFAQSWPWILVCLLMSWFFSLLFMVLLRFTAQLLLWTTVLAVTLLLSYGLWFCALELTRLTRNQGSEVSVVEVGLQTDVKVYLHLKQTWILLLVLLGATEVSMVLLLLVMRRRVQLAVVLLREASRAMCHTKSTMVYPVLTCLSLASCLCYCALTALNLASLGHKVMSPDNNSTCDPEPQMLNRSPAPKQVWCVHGDYQRYLVPLQVCNLLVFLWLANFSLALQQCTLAGTFSRYYWTRRTPCPRPRPLLSSFGMALRYHTGSLAFGALVISVLTFFRILLEYLERKMKGLKSSVSKFFCCCLQCCFCSLDTFLSYINSNAYIMMAIYGKSLCRSAREAFCLLMRNLLRVAVVDRVTDFLLFLGKVLVSGGTGVLAGLFFTGRLPLLQDHVPGLHRSLLPTLTVVAGSYLVAHGFFSVYQTCVDTFFLCFCDDLERNDGSAEKPYLTSPDLHRILEKSRRSH
ncbi:choline transporter-like protein 5-A [Nerophis ophidion]|uniref:choline transporter-like protein 5-A n=1 Tax=Nerophis ophidion TaxID=159077 RepID=UPI002AE0869B|nr:choline transporter-like protein 5-A [Nerophis ophidion]